MDIKNVDEITHNQFLLSAAFGYLIKIYDNEQSYFCQEKPGRDLGILGICFQAKKFKIDKVYMIKYELFDKKK
jgi:hypothetical protein